MSTKENNILVIVPAYNEEQSIVRVADILRATSGIDFVVVNDGSTDSTPQILDEAGIPHIDLVMNLGIGGAVQTGYRYAYAHGYDIAIQFDGDGQHDANYIGAICDPILAGEADLVVGSRFVGNESDFKSSAARRAGIRLLSGILKLSTGLKIHDVTSGFRAMGPRALKIFANNYPADYPEPESLATAARHGLAVKEVGVAMHPRESGTSSIRPLNSVYYMIKVGLAIMLAPSSRKAK